MPKRNFIVNLRRNVRVIFQDPIEYPYPSASLQYRFKIFWRMYTWKSIRRIHYHTCDIPSPYQDPHGYSKALAKIQRKNKYEKINTKQMISNINKKQLSLSNQILSNINNDKL